MFNKYKQRITELESQLNKFTQYKDEQDYLYQLKAEQNKLLDEIGILKKTISDYQNKAKVAKDLMNKYKDEQDKALRVLNNTNDEIWRYFSCYSTENFLMDEYTSEYIKDELDSVISKQKAWQQWNDVVRMDDFDYDMSFDNLCKLLETLRWFIGASFNGACDKAINKMKYNGLKKTQQKILSIRSEYTKKLKFIKFTISDDYVEFKLQEAQLVHDFLAKKNEEKEEIRRQREIIKEQERVEREIEQKELKLEAEMKQAYKAEDDKRVAELQTQIDALEEKKTHPKAGWVYVISNPDEKEGIVKIGITRRDDPLVRVRELGDASHSFAFDVHGLFFAEDCFKLEADLHRYFADRRVNQLKPHREHFYCTLDEVADAFEHFGYHIDLNHHVINEDYIESKNILKNRGIFI